MRPTKERLFDEMLVAKIVAAAEDKGVKVRRGMWGISVPDTGGHCKIDFGIKSGAVCAVGAGCLYADIPRGDYASLQRWGVTSSTSAVVAFASLHGVTVDYAAGVSDGFENDRQALNWAAGSNYNRGIAVGEAVRAYFEEE